MTDKLNLNAPEDLKAMHSIPTRFVMKSKKEIDHALLKSCEHSRKQAIGLLGEDGFRQFVNHSKEK